MASSSAPAASCSGVMVGAGSFGRRHLSNLARLGGGPLGAVGLVLARADGTAPVPLAQGARDLEVVDTFRRSARQARRVRVGRRAGAAAHP